MSPFGVYDKGFSAYIGVPEVWNYATKFMGPIPRWEYEICLLCQKYLSILRNPKDYYHDENIALLYYILSQFSPVHTVMSCFFAYVPIINKSFYHSMWSRQLMKRHYIKQEPVNIWIGGLRLYLNNCFRIIRMRGYFVALNVSVITQLKLDNWIICSLRHFSFPYS
jgi:hypothetical protein